MAGIRNQAIATKITGASSVPLRRAASGAAFARMRTMPMPQMEDTRPMLASASGRNIMPSRISMAMVEAMAMQAIIEPQ